jgi:hypothetical protein
MPTLTAPDLTKIERPTIDLSDIEMPKFDLPKVDVGGAVTSAATAVGLMSKPRSRRPFVIGLGIAVAVAAAGWAWMNYEMLRERATEMAAKVGDRLGMMRSDTDESVAFTSAEPKPIDATGAFDASRPMAGPGAAKKDYPNGFGTTSDMASTSGDELPVREKASTHS